MSDTLKAFTHVILIILIILECNKNVIKCNKNQILCEYLLNNLVVETLGKLTIRSEKF